MGLTPAQSRAVTGLVQAVPDATLARLSAALSTARIYDPLFGPISDITRVEMDDRNARDIILEPLKRLADTTLASPKRALLAPGELARIWRLMKVVAPQDVLASSRAAQDPKDESSSMFDALCQRAAAALRQPDEVSKDPRSLDLAMLLGLCPNLRATMSMLSAWARNLNFENMTLVRLAFRDATNTDEGAGPIFIEALLAYLDQPCQILRLISAIMDRPTERYLAASELGGVGERLLADVDEKLRIVKSFNPSRGVEGGTAAAAAALSASLTIREFEQWLALDKAGPWSIKIVAQKRDLAAAVETHLRQTEALVGQALPLQQERHAGSLSPRATPRIDGLPDAMRVRRAEGLLAFLDETRSSAANAGFGALRAKVIAAVEFYIASYVEDVIERLRGEEAADPEWARAYLDVAADFCRLVTGPDAAQIVRRRALAAA